MRSARSDRGILRVLLFTRLLRFTPAEVPVRERHPLSSLGISQERNKRDGNKNTTILWKSRRETGSVKHYSTSPIERVHRKYEIVAD